MSTVVVVTVDVVYLTPAVGEQPSASHTVGVHNNPNSNSAIATSEVGSIIWDTENNA